MLDTVGGMGDTLGGMRYHPISFCLCGGIRLSDRLSNLFFVCVALKWVDICVFWGVFLSLLLYMGISVFLFRSLATRRYTVGGISIHLSR